mmetsp:Transcript_44463/g.71064  ORF Transcript_44463/g.71064 Transcript_44463/m.71064 type:complete len:205 (-) Transcript_44463:1306-1920(-)
MTKNKNDAQRAPVCNWRTRCNSPQIQGITMCKVEQGRQEGRRENKNSFQHNFNQSGWAQLVLRTPSNCTNGVFSHSRSQEPSLVLGKSKPCHLHPLQLLPFSNQRILVVFDVPLDLGMHWIASRGGCFLQAFHCCARKNDAQLRSLQQKALRSDWPALHTWLYKISRRLFQRSEIRPLDQKKGPDNQAALRKMEEHGHQARMCC